jgi:hypothetical protein
MFDSFSDSNTGLLFLKTSKRWRGWQMAEIQFCDTRACGGQLFKIPIKARLISEIYNSVDIDCFNFHKGGRSKPEQRK